MNTHYRWSWFLAFPLLLITVDGRAEIDWTNPLGKLDLKLPDNVQIHGFASQAYILTENNNFFGYSKNMGSLDFTEMGINGSWRPRPDLQTSMQVVYRRAGLTDDSYARIDFGFLDYSFLSDPEHLVGVRLGRVVNPYGLYNDTRDMPFTRPSIFLPQSIYFDINRNTALSGDGIQLYGEHRTDYGDFLLQFNGMQSRANDPAWKPVLFARSVDGQLSWVGRLMYEWQGGRVRVGVTSADLNVGFQPRQVDYKTRSSLSFAPVLFSFQYNAEDWSLTSEYAIRYSEVDNLGQKISFAGESYYVQGAYRFTTELEAFLRYDVYYGDRSDRNGKKLQASGLGSAHEAFAKDIAVGFRWDVTQSIMLRTEYHYVDGAGWLYVGENKDGLSKYWSMFAASISFRF